VYGVHNITGNIIPIFIHHNTVSHATSRCVLYDSDERTKERKYLALSIPKRIHGANRLIIIMHSARSRLSVRTPTAVRWPQRSDKIFSKFMARHFGEKLREFRPQTHRNVPSKALGISLHYIWLFVWNDLGGELNRVSVVGINDVKLQWYNRRYTGNRMINIMKS